jgi:hypothetical protein
MSIKNQKTLIISASLIIGLTVVSLFTLNIVVEKISRITPPPFAMNMQKKPPSPMGVDDALKNGFPAKQVPPNGANLGIDDQVPPKLRRPDTQIKPNNGRVRTGKDAPDIRRMQPPSNGQGGGSNDSQRRPPSPPPSTPNSPPQGAMDEQQRRMMEEDMERRREMYYDQPPPGYYAPPPGDEYYDNGYGRDGYEYDYDNYYEDMEGKKDSKAKDKKTASTTEHADEANEALEDLAYDVEDEYLQDLGEE